jgi:hypothetical protein
MLTNRLFLLTMSAPGGSGHAAAEAGFGFDPSATLAVHCGNGFAARFEPYQSARLRRYNAVS